MNKEELNKEIEKLKVSLEAHEEQVKDLNHDLATAKQRLEDCDKPKLTQKQFAKLHTVIETSVENFDFNQVDNYNVEMGMEYDNKVYLDNIEFECHADLYEQIIHNVESLFGVADESDDDNESPSE
jgi:chromosome segregation ATPase